MKYFVFLVLIVAANFANSHSRWLVPSHTILSGEKAEYVSFDFSVSNDIFHPDNAYGGVALQNINKAGSLGNKPINNPFARIMASTRLVVALPDGRNDDSMPIVNLGRKSASSYLLSQSGTYRISLTQDPIFFISYADAQGRHQRLFGTMSENREKLASIQGASDIVASKLVNRVETFVTRNASTEKNIQPSKQGLSFEFKHHPNELFVGEKVEVRLLLNGSPVVEGTEVHLVRGGTRYRNEREKRTLLTGKKGKLEMEFSLAGLYLVEIEVEKDASNAEHHKDLHALYLTLEVNPE